MPHCPAPPVEARLALSHDERAASKLSKNLHMTGKVWLQRRWDGETGRPYVKAMPRPMEARCTQPLQFAEAWRKERGARAGTGCFVGASEG